MLNSKLNQAYISRTEDKILSPKKTGLERFLPGKSMSDTGKILQIRNFKLHFSPVNSAPEAGITQEWLADAELVRIDSINAGYFTKELIITNLVCEEARHPANTTKCPIPNQESNQITQTEQIKRQP